jgi:NADH dehydrogenase (ubiquinone) 1 beta subcomplex subunit 8
MLSSRILTRRLPQVAARFTAPRASFSQVRGLSAAEIDDPLQVCRLSRPGC